MKSMKTAAVFLMVMSYGCASETVPVDAVSETGETFFTSGTVTFFKNQGFVANTREVRSDGSGITVDMVAYANGSWLDLKGGRQGTSYMPLDDLNRATFQSLSSVPCKPPMDNLEGARLYKAETGHAFTVRGNISEGTIKGIIKSIDAGGAITVEYEICD